MNDYITIKEPCEILQVIKKSKFYCRLFPVKSVEEAQEIINQCKKKYWDASHNCSAFIIGRNSEISRSSDDGEPQGTAGVPMLEVLRREKVSDILAICTRYFGGTLLGASGLIRAYSSSVAEALSEAEKITYRELSLYYLEISFSAYGKLEHYLNSNGIGIKNTEYYDKVHMTVSLEEEEIEPFLKKVSEITSGEMIPQFVSKELSEMRIG